MTKYFFNTLFVFIRSFFGVGGVGGINQVDGDDIDFHRVERIERANSYSD